MIFQIKQLTITIYIIHKKSWIKIHHSCYSNKGKNKTVVATAKASEYKAHNKSYSIGVSMIPLSGTGRTPWNYNLPIQVKSLSKHDLEIQF